MGRLTTRRGLDSLQRGSGAHGRNGRDPAVDQEICPDDVRRIVPREVNCQLRDFQRIGNHAGQVRPYDVADATYGWEYTGRRRIVPRVRVGCGLIGIPEEGELS